MIRSVSKQFSAEEENMTEWSSILKKASLLGPLLCLALPVSAQKNTFDDLRAEKPVVSPERYRADLAKVMARIADKINAVAAVRIDDETMTAGAKWDEADMRMVYGNKMVQRTKAQLDHDRFIVRMSPILKHNACTNKGARFMLDSGVTLVWSYVDQADQPSGAVTVVGKDCAGMAVVDVTPHP